MSDHSTTPDFAHLYFKKERFLVGQKLLSPCVVILTALSVEFQAVSAHILHYKKDVRHRTVYWLGTFPCSGCLWKVCSVEIGPSNSIAAIKTTQAIQDFQPDVVLFVGVAGGLKDVGIGDVVAARKIYSYELGKDSTTFLPRPEIAQATPRMESGHAQSEMSNYGSTELKIILRFIHHLLLMLMSRRLPLVRRS